MREERRERERIEVGEGEGEGGGEIKRGKDGGEERER